MQLKKRSVMISIASLMVILAIIGGFFWFNQTDEFTGPIQTNTTLNQSEYLIGDRMILTLTIWMEPGYQVESPTITPPEGVELVEKETGEVEKTRKYVKYIDRYTFQTFEPGEYQLADLQIRYATVEGEEKELTLNGPILAVNSLLSEDETDIRDLKPIAEPSQGLALYYLLAGLVLVVVIGYLIYRYFRGRTVEEVEVVEPPLPAHELAYQRLRDLELSAYIENGEIERYFTILSQILREYIEKRFGVKAQEMTTQEFMAKALNSVAMNRDHQDLLRMFMYKADLVKYAQYVPEYQQIHQTFQAAKRFVDETKFDEKVEEGGEIDVSKSDL